MIRITRGAGTAGMVVLSLALLIGTARSDYRLAPSDGVRIKVQDWPDLAGDYAVGPDGTLSLPMIGTIKAQGMNTETFAAAVSDALRRITGRTEPVVAAVEIVRFRPFFVMGDVQRAGELAFRPGLTVLQAVGMAGGYYRPPTASLLRLERDVALATGDIDTLTLRMLKALGRVARLEAALAGKSEIAFPPELLQRQQQAGVANAMDNERAILALELRRLTEEGVSLESIRTLYRREIVSLRGQGEALKREQDAVQRQLVELRSLAGRGLALTPNMIALERTLAQNQNEQLGMNTAIVRSEQNIELAEQKHRDQIADRLRQHAAALQEAKTDAADARRRIVTAEELLDEALATERAEGRNPGNEIIQRRSVIVVRQGRAGLEEFPADDGMALQPGDVLKVMPLPPRRLTSEGSPRVQLRDVSRGN
jgi:polysaccharide biosynthesis/export protein ExoF